MVDITLRIPLERAAEKARQEVQRYLVDARTSRSVRTPQRVQRASTLTSIFASLEHVCRPLRSCMGDPLGSMVRGFNADAQLYWRRILYLSYCSLQMWVHRDGIEEKTMVQTQKDEENVSRAHHSA